MCGSLDMIGCVLHYVWFIGWGLCFLLFWVLITHWNVPFSFHCRIFISSQIILFQFGLGANAYYVILELYAQGNIILADSEFTVMTLLRSHRFESHSYVQNKWIFWLETCHICRLTTFTYIWRRYYILHFVSKAF